MSESESHLISLILAPPFPIIHPIRSLGILISVVAAAVVARAAVAAPGWPRLLAAAKVARAKTNGTHYLTSIRRVSTQKLTLFEFRIIFGSKCVEN